MMKRIIFLGQKPIGEQCFELLAGNQNENYEIVAAVSNDSADGVWWHTCGIKKYCAEKGLAFISSGRPAEEEIARVIKECNADFLISVGYGWILGEDILGLINHRAVNLHLAKLPEYGGNFTYNHAILNEEEEYGVTLHWMVEKVDRGDCVYTDTFRISEEDTAQSLYLKSVDAGLTLFRKFVGLLMADAPIPRSPMRGTGAFYSRKSLDGLRLIKDSADQSEVSRKSRAFYFPPFEAAYLLIGGKKYYVIPDSNKKLE